MSEQDMVKGVSADAASASSHPGSTIYPVCDQQLVARIKKSSKYWGQTAPNEWFDVRVVGDSHYQLRGNHNNYRLVDVVMGVRFADGTIVDLKSGKSTHG